MVIDTDLPKKGLQMKKKSVFYKVLPLIVIINLLFIWGNSMLDAEKSGAISDWLARLLSATTDSAVRHGHLRKIAHATEFTFLGAGLMLLCRHEWRNRTLALLIGLAVALTDETIQLFVEGRSGQISDVWIDVGGVFLGSIIATIVLEVRRRKGKTTD